jgi:glycosyltransferase involved in cell wall biosynthesis
VAVFAANRAYGIASSRLPLVERFLRGGWRVVTAGARDPAAERLIAAGAEFVEIPFRRGGISSPADLRAVLALRRLYGALAPVMIHHFNTKPIILGGLAAPAASGAVVFNTVTGLGYGIYGGGVTARVLRRAYRHLLPRAVRTVFQNSDDLAYFIEHRLVDPTRAEAIVSSGVAAADFRVPPRRGGERVTVALVGRLLWQKGVADFAAAAARLRPRLPALRMCLAGEPDPTHPDAVPAEWLEARVVSGDLEYAGYVRDMPGFLAGVDVLAAPSTFGEGVPRVVLEAGASGVPVVASDVPGTREVVRDGETGFLVPPGDPVALAARIEEFALDPVLRARLGAAARERVSRDFDRGVILERYAALYRAGGIDPDRAPAA